MKISVAICTWNRAELLDRTLAEMRNLRIPEGVEWELLIVNNNCTDMTDTVIDRYRRQLPIRRLFEHAQGLSHGRNHALDAASGDLLIFTDDDVLVDPEWLAAYAAAAQSWPQATYFGGTIHHWFAVAPPAWIERN